MKRFIIFLIGGLIIFGLSLNAWAGKRRIDFVPGFTIALPLKSRVEVSLLNPPLSEAALERAPLEAPSFSAGPGDNVWLALKPYTLVNARFGYPVKLESPVSDILRTDEGGLLIASYDSLGYLAVEQQQDGKISAAYQPFTVLPLEYPRLAEGSGRSVYVYGLNKNNGQYEVYLLQRGPFSTAGDSSTGLSYFSRIFVSAQKISSVTGSETDTFIATGRMVLRLSRTSNNPVLYFAHPKEDVLELAGSPQDGLFYATITAIGLVTDKGPLEFIRAPNSAIHLTCGALYILLKNNFAVVKVGAASSLKEISGQLTGVTK